MESIEISGEVIRIKDKQTFGNDLQKQEIVIKTDGKYPQELPIEFFREDKIALIQGVRVGDSITCHCNLNGREWKDHDRWFLSLSCWKISNVEGNESHESTPASRAQDEHQEKKQDGYAPDQSVEDDDSSIPF